MSWRLLFLTLLLALGASALGGMQLGDWLVQKAPVAVPAPGQNDPDPDQVVLDANGKPYTRQPPQPRVDGTLGVPDEPANPDWRITSVSLFETVANPNVIISRERVGASEARQLAQAGAQLQGPQDIVTVDVARPGEGSHPAPIPGQAPPAYANPPMQPAPGQGQQAGAAQPGWQQAFQAEMEKCSRAGFFERPTCAWNARNKYCAPNNAWGQVEGCPRRSF